jgi:hypothetical protein
MLLICHCDFVELSSSSSNDAPRSGIVRSGFATTVYAVTLRLPDILRIVHDLRLTRRRIRDTEEQKLGSSDN